MNSLRNGACNVYLLDTCAFYWLCAQPKRLPSNIKRIIDREGDAIHISHVSLLEFGNLWLAGKIVDQRAPRQWLRDQMTIWSFPIIRLDEEDIVRSTELPVHHRDPFDRLLIAQAIIRNFVFLTPDQIIQRYPVSTLW